MIEGYINSTELRAGKLELLLSWKARFFFVRHLSLKNVIV